ncbi:MAG: hypothetical protein QXU44_04665 [Candidatus Caldarchaeum sp.]
MGNPSYTYFDEVTMKYSDCDTGRYVLCNIVHEDGVIVKIGQQDVE